MSGNQLAKPGQQVEVANGLSGILADLPIRRIQVHEKNSLND